MYDRILVPTDGSRLSLAAEDAAISFARICGSDIVALAVAQPEPVLLTAEGALAGGAGLQVDVLLEAAQHHAQRVAAAAAAAGVHCTPLTAYAYAPADKILEAARQQHCQLIFMASHGRHGLSRLIAGSVTQRVLAYADVPVMVYRAGAAATAPPANTADAAPQSTGATPAGT